MDTYAFYTGKSFDAYEFLGCHMTETGAVFRTFAPAAERICVICESCGWEETPMNRILDGNFWECTLPKAGPGDMYKYRIYLQDGRCLDHCDPYGYGMELRPHNASIIRELLGYTFQDEEWMRERAGGRNGEGSSCQGAESPGRRSGALNIYELHAGSWKKKGEEVQDWYSYEELAEELIPYLKEMGYNCVELLPLGEHPCDESWGYQQTGFFSPTSRYGTAEQLMRMVDRLHQEGIGVILDFVPVHFAVDDYALADYDGTSLYEYPNSDVGQSEWGSKNFMHSRGEVRSFLQSCADYWLGVYHMDGLRMDAISNMIYWQGDPARGVNGNAVDFLKGINAGLKRRHPGILLAAEDSTSFPGVTRAVEEGGLGFDYKWNMGWMNDTLDFFRTAPEYRSRDYHKLTFSMMYYYDETYLLPLSHDEVVHGKATIIQKMNGDYVAKFPQARALYMYMYAHPGKKLNFMGNELAHFREWDEKRELDWELLQYPLHDAFRHFAAELNRFYLEHPALWAQDYDREGFEWLECHDEAHCVYAFSRKGDGEEITAVFNLSDRRWKEYALAVPGACYELTLSSDWDVFGGEGATEKGKCLKTKKGKLFLGLPPFSGLYLRRREELPAIE